MLRITLALVISIPWVAHAQEGADELLPPPPRATQPATPVAPPVQAPPEQAPPEQPTPEQAPPEQAPPPDEPPAEMFIPAPPEGTYQPPRPPPQPVYQPYVNPRLAQRAQALERRRLDNEERMRVRNEEPWALRVAATLLATPRTEEFGDTFVFPGVGIHFALIRWLNPFLRLELAITGAYVLNDVDIENHGPEGALGGFLVASSASRTRFGGGFGIEAVLAREFTFVEGHHGWLGMRLDLMGEIGWMSRSGAGFVLQVLATGTYAPDEGISPGAIFRLGFEFGVSPSSQ